MTRRSRYCLRVILGPWLYMTFTPKKATPNLFPSLFESFLVDIHDTIRDSLLLLASPCMHEAAAPFKERRVGDHIDTSKPLGKHVTRKGGR